MNETRGHHVKQSKLDSERQLLHIFPQMQDLHLNIYECKAGGVYCWGTKV
jgi:hypothetical protein